MCLYEKESNEYLIYFLEKYDRTHLMVNFYVSLNFNVLTMYYIRILFLLIVNLIFQLTKFNDAKF